MKIERILNEKEQTSQIQGLSKMKVVRTAVYARVMTGEYRPAKPNSVTERVLAESHMLGATETEASPSKSSNLSF